MRPYVLSFIITAGIWGPSTGGGRLQDTPQLGDMRQAGRQGLLLWPRLENRPVSYLLMLCEDAGQHY